MPNILAIISKAQFEQASPSARVGDRLGLKRYSSANKALESLREDGALFLVTVRPPDEKLWLVGILEGPKFKADGWEASPSSTPITDVSKLRKALKFLSGKGIEAKPGALGMSLQTPRGLTDADVTLLREAAGGAPADAAPAPVEVNAPAVEKASAVKPATAPKRAAPAEVDEEEDDAPAPEPAATARDDSPALLAAWRKNPCAELAEALQARLRATTPAAQPASEKEWLRRAKAPAELSELAMLLSEIRGPTMADIYRRADALALLMPDPRIAQALADFAGNVPFTSDSSTNMWSRVFRALEKSGDPRLLSWIPQVRSALGVRPTFKKYFEASLASLEDVLKAQFPSGIPAPSAPSAALLASLPAVVAKPKSSVPGRDELFAEVYANPIDDGPRLVLADLLQEQGDPRGEFIALQCHQPGSKRERELLKEHGKAWLGELAPWVGADFEFRRGFPSAVSIKLKNENEMKKTRDLRAWSTIEILTMGKAGPTGETFAQAVPRTLRAIGELRGLFDQGVEWLLAHGTSYRPTRLEFRALRQRELWERLVGSGVCEKLTDVEGINLDWVVSSPLVGQLAEIRVEALLADEHLETVLRHPHLKLHFGNQDHAGTVAMEDGLLTVTFDLPVIGEKTDNHWAKPGSRQEKEGTLSEGQRLINTLTAKAGQGTLQSLKLTRSDPRHAGRVDPELKPVIEKKLLAALTAHLDGLRALRRFDLTCLGGTAGERKPRIAAVVAPPKVEQAVALPKMFFNAPLQWCANGGIAVLQEDEVPLFDGGSGKLLRVLATTDSSLATFSPDGKRMVYASWKVAFVLDLESAGHSRKVEHPNGNLSQVNLSADGKRLLMLIGEDYSERRADVLDLDTGKILFTRKDVRSAALHPDGKSVILGRTNARLERFSVDDNKAKGVKIVALEGDPTELACSPDFGRCVVKQYDGPALIIDLEKNVVTGQIKLDGIDCESLAMSARHAAIVGSKGVKLFGFDGAKHGALKKGYQAAFSPDGEKIAVLSDSTLVVSELSGKELWRQGGAKG